jgi:NAD(P)H dehydrogenase (quinone)
VFFYLNGLISNNMMCSRKGENQMIAITAANGTLGQAVMAEFQKQISPLQVRLTARNIEKLCDIASLGFDVARADYDDPVSMEKAFRSIDTLLLISGTDPNELKIANHRAAIDAAITAGVRRVVYTSFTNPVPGSKFIWATPHVDTEAYLMGSGLTYVILRDNQYASNLDSLLAQAIETGVFAIPGANGKVAYITHQDIAAAIVGVLTGSGQDNKIYELTGPQAFNAYDIAEVLSQALNREIAVVDAPLESFATYFRSVGMPEYVVKGLVSIYAASGADEYAKVSNDISMLTGRPATSLREYINNFIKG